VHRPASRRAPWRRTIATLAAATLVVAACGGGDDEEGGGGGGGGEATTTTAPTAEPTRGGTLVYAVEADTAAPWLPSSMVCAAACHSTVGRTVFEPLVVLADDGNYYPYLLESIEPNADFTSWTLVVREGVKFHDGTDLNADAVAAHIEATRTSALLQAAVKPIVEVVSDGAMTVTVNTDVSWPAFPTYLNSQLGYVPSPTWTAAVTAGTAQPTEPVGTGPFKFESYEAGENGRFVASRFEDYWRGDGPNAVTGEGLPYLDGIEVRFIPDSQARSQALLAGDIDLVQTNNGVEINDLESEDGVFVTTLTSPFETEVSYLLINNSADVQGAPNPFADIRVRRALAHATNNEVLSEARTAGRFPPANGPFAPGVIGHLEDTGAPQYDPDAARALLEEVQAETGSPVTIAYKTTTDPFNLTTAELLKEMWEEVGFTVTIDQIPQGEFINEALAGNFQVFGWRNHSGIDPDQQFVWWSSTAATGIALNFGRIIDPEVDRLLGEIRSQTDEAARTAAAEDLNRYFGEQVFNVWNNWVFWGLAHDDNVFNVKGTTIPGAPEGVRGLNIGANLAGAIFPGEIFESPAD
jgi:peptide/nickel transport system substrate-binding protein